MSVEAQVPEFDQAFAKLSAKEKQLAASMVQDGYVWKYYAPVEDRWGGEPGVWMLENDNGGYGMFVRDDEDSAQYDDWVVDVLAGMEDMVGDPFTEDKTFLYGGYWKGVFGQLVEGDAFRIDADNPCLVVHQVRVNGDRIDLLVSDRRVHVAQTLSNALGRVIDGMSDDPKPQVLSRPATDPVWVRL